MTTAVNTETGEIASTINYAIHPAADWFPLLEGPAFQQLVEDIREHGQEVPVVLDADGRLLDGRNRARACQALGLDVKETRYAGNDPVGFVISHNVHRRHLTESQRAMVAAKLVTFKQGDNRFTTVEAPIGASTQRDAAAALNVSRNSVQRATAIQNFGSPELNAQVESGEITVNKAAGIIKAKRTPVKDEADSFKTGTPRSEKAERLRELAEQGYTSEQMRKPLGFSRMDMVRELAREYHIEIPADMVRGRSRRIDHMRVLDNVAEAAEVAAMSLRDLDAAQLDKEEALERLDSLTTSINALSKAVKKIKESLHE